MVEALGRHWWRYALGVALVALVLTATLRRRAPEQSRPDPLAKLDSRMVAVKDLIDAGDLPAATTKLRATYRFDRSEGFGALRQFAMLVLERGLQDKDPFE
ncbi:MAG: hypothetical protein ACREQD_17390, partial [Candidatus Binataceae bacterium]